MSSFKNFASMLNDLQQQADGRGTLDGSAIEDFLSIAGYEDPNGGGGGDSDFTIARVTIADSTTGYVTEDYSMPVVIDDELYGPAAVYTMFPLARDEESVVEVPLYKGKLIIFSLENENPVYSGDAVYNEDTYETTITGDCVLLGKLLH